MTISDTNRRAPGVGVAVAVCDAGRILLVRRALPPAAGLWAFPGGRIELGETMRAAAEREVAEETGLHVQVTVMLDVREVITPTESGALAHWVVVVWRADLQPGAREPVAGDDAADARWFAAAELDALATLPGVTDLALRLIADDARRGV